MIGVFSTWLPLAAAAAYIVTFYITPYNEIYYADSDDSDVPFTLAIVECSWSAATFIFGMLLSAVAGSKRVHLIAAVFFGVGVLLQGTAGIMRGTNLGVFGDDESTCLDASLSGCPTSRYEAVNDEIQFTAPSGGDCQFWFWGPDMRARYTGADACGGYGQTDGACGPLIENYMDWSRASSYGWRDDPADIAAASAGHIATIDKVHNMKYLFGLQATIGNVSIPPAYAYTVQPSIADCWYWGCSPVCQPHRYRVNRWWLVSSGALFVVYVVCMILSLVAWRRRPAPVVAKAVAKAVAVPDVESPLSFRVPEIGRRKRRVLQNPSGLLF